MSTLFDHALLVQRFQMQDFCIPFLLRDFLKNETPIPLNKVKSSVLLTDLIKIVFFKTKTSLCRENQKKSTH